MRPSDSLGFLIWTPIHSLMLATVHVQAEQGGSDSATCSSAPVHHVLVLSIAPGTCMTMHDKHLASCRPQRLQE